MHSYIGFVKIGPTLDPWLPSPAVCDTIVATGDVTADGSVVFAKNSDREPGEAQVLELHPPRRRSDSPALECTYLEVPEALETRSVLISRPHWMWGAEMGANDRGVVVGNEAVFTRAPCQEIGLLGMDLVRLTLERAESARGGVSVLTGLLEDHGQGGAAGHRDKAFRYDNSFIVADPSEAWVVETAGRAWVTQRVRGVRAISNGLTIRSDWDSATPHLAALARDYGLHRGKGPVDFARTFSDTPMTEVAAASRRRACTEEFLRHGSGAITPRLAMRALRQHGDADPGRGVLTSVCAHASWLPTRRAGQTTSSMVSRLTGATATHYFTATAAPCTSVFKPFWVDSGVPDLGPSPGDEFDERALWWRHELLHRAALADLPAFVEAFRGPRSSLERRFGRDADEAVHAHATAAERRAICANAVAAADDLEREWIRRAPGRARLPGALHRRFWRSLDRRSGLTGAA